MSHGPLQLDQLRLPHYCGVIGRSIQLFDVVTSTNDLALKLSDDPSRHGWVIFAEAQTAGRGRFNRSWHAPRGASILCSVLLFLDPESVPARTLVLWTALAVRAAIREACDVDTDLKWPNDLLIQGKKVAGILIETRPVAGPLRACVVGIGINCLQHAAHFPDEISQHATSLEVQSKFPVDRVLLARTLLCSLDHWLQEAERSESASIRDAWLSHALSIGQRLILSVHGKLHRGSLIELDPHAGILVELDQGGRQLFDPHTTNIHAVH